MHQQLFLEEDWTYLLSFLPPRTELDGSAWTFGAIRRVREISSGGELLRLMMAYGFCGLSLRRTAAWAAEAGVANISDPSLLDRFVKGSQWLEHILALKLADHAALAPSDAPDLTVRLVDASCIRRVGSRQTDWRLHLSLNLRTMRIDQLEVTDAKGGERLTRFSFGPGELVVADAGYATRPGLRAVAGRKADFLVRINCTNVPLVTANSTAVDVLEHCRAAADGRPAEFPVSIRDTPIGPCRLLITRKTSPAAEQSRRRKEAERRKNGSATIDLRTLESSEYVILLTSATADVLPLDQAFELYRFRWQVELVFKRLKSILHIDKLPAKNAALARMTLASKILGALLVDDYLERYVSFSPWGYVIRAEH